MKDFWNEISNFVIYYILTLPLWFGAIYLPTRLYFIGEERQETVAAIEIKEDAIHSGNWEMLIPYSSLTLKNYPEPFESYKTNYSVGQKIVLLYSDRLHLGIIVPNEYGYFSVLYNYRPLYGGMRVFDAIMIFIGLAIAIPIRSRRLLAHIARGITTTWHETMQNKKSVIEKTIAITDFASQISTMCVAVSCIFVLVILVVKIILLVEKTGLFLTTVVLIAASSLLLTPVLEKIIDTIIKIRRTEIFKDILVILRNLVATVAGGILVYKLILFNINEDFQKFENVKNVFFEFISVLLG